ncbi:DUF3137 domain-containing protein [Campylobacter sp. RM12654]|uniref:DUF3137 domain-containing protein n=1 Tax=Campylobacter sp. RM12654 TaxID=2735738 RepID=UPI00301562BA|nr:DUF3137 domain-containing protein [Campylobacter sp. RM12654]
MIEFLKVFRIICIVCLAIYLIWGIARQFQNIYIMFILIVFIIISSFFISYIQYKNIIKPFFISNSFNEISNISDIRKGIINSESLNIEFAYNKDDLDILKVNIKNTYYTQKDKKREKDIFKGIYIRKKNIKMKDFIIVSNSDIKDILGVKEPLILLDNVDFNKYFKLYSNNNLEVFKFLNPKKLDIISNNAKLINHKISLFYKDNYLHTYIHNFSFSENIEKEFKSIINIVNEF